MKTILFSGFITLLLYAACTPSRPQPEERKLPVIVEVIQPDSTAVESKFLERCRAMNIPVESLYIWNNHWVVFDTLATPEVLIQQLQADYPAARIEYYENPFYLFDRNLCEDQMISGKWSHTLMTANLVDDIDLQQEYMEHHATQFEKWPEISKGFCNAEFQQLLIYRNKRQLMLIISIPHEKTLDELNPKTAENNPRVDEWNVMMAKYQEGIEGTQPGETWVIFTPVSHFANAIKYAE